MWLDENIPDKCVWAIINKNYLAPKCIKIKVTSTFTNEIVQMESHCIDFTMIWQKLSLKNNKQQLNGSDWITSNDRLKTLMNGDVSLSLIGCFFVIKSNIAIFRQLHYLQHKRPWEFSVWTRTTIENNMNHSCKNGFPPLSYLYAICSH